MFRQIKQNIKKICPDKLNKIRGSQENVSRQIKQNDGQTGVTYFANYKSHYIPLVMLVCLYL